MQKPDKNERKGKLVHAREERRTINELRLQKLQ